MPAKHLRLEGDYYAEDAEDAVMAHRPTDTPGEPRVEQQPGSSTLHLPMPHAPHLLGTKYDRPTWIKENWEDLRVGDFVRLHGDESVPAGESTLRAPTREAPPTLLMFASRNRLDHLRDL
jgi:phospholipid-translocating ATPase